MAQRLEDLLDIVGSQALENPVARMGMNLTGTPNINYLKNLANLVQQQQEPQLGPNDFGSYTIPVSDPTYRSGFDYARSIAGGIPMSQVIAPGVSYSPEQPMGYTQEQLNRPKDMPAPPPPPRSIDRRGDDVDFLGTGIGGVNIPVDRKQDFPPLSNLLNIGKLFGGGFDQEAIDKIVQERIAESMPTFEQPDLSQFVTKQDIPSFIPDIPTGREFSIDRDELIKDIRAGIDIPKYEAPDLSQFVRQEDIPAPNVFDEEALRKELMEDIRGSINIPQMPDLSGLARLEDIPQYQAPDLSGFARLEDIPTMPTFDREALIEDIRSGIDIPQPPSIDREALIKDITGRIDLPKPPSIDRQALIEDIRSGIELPTYEAPDLSSFARLEDIPTFDPTGLQEQITALQQRPNFDPTSIQQDISQLQTRPQFDPTGLQAQIGLLQQDIGQITPFNPTSLQQQIGGLEQQITGIPQFDPSGLQEQISGLQQQIGGIPQFDPTGLQAQIAANQAALAGIDIPTAPDVSQFVTQEDIQRAISGIDIPTFQAPDFSPYETRIAELEQQIAGLQVPTGGRFSVDRKSPIGLF